MTDTPPAWDFPKPFTREITVGPADIDGLGHTNNTRYAKWCEDVAWDHSSALGLDIDRYRSLDRAMAVTRSEYDYLQAAYEGDQLLAATWIIDWDGKLSMRRRFQIIRPVDGATVLRGLVRFVCIELSSGKPRRLPPEFIAGYGPAIVAN
ncbi:MAG: thioesterase family protein [Pseudomonadota bacterium]